MARTGLSASHRDHPEILDLQAGSANQGAAPVQLLKRSWMIIDAAGRTQHVHGEGVIGQTPVIEPGATFEYTSGTPLGEPSGFMRGLYHMVDRSSGAAFDVTIPPFSLDSPHQPTGVH